MEKKIQRVRAAELALAKYVSEMQLLALKIQQATSELQLATLDATNGPSIFDTTEEWPLDGNLDAQQKGTSA